MVGDIFIETIYKNREHLRRTNWIYWNIRITPAIAGRGRKNMDELKPCPFCGDIPRVHFRDYGRGVTEAWIYHNKLTCPVEIKMVPQRTREAVIKRWNRRTPSNSQEKGEGGMSGLRNLCKLYGSMTIQGVEWVWDYHRDVLRKKTDMTQEEWALSERARFTPPSPTGAPEGKPKRKR